jgi:N-acetylmuramoyl-L-alanine amidase
LKITDYRLQIAERADNSSLPAIGYRLTPIVVLLSAICCLLTFGQAREISLYDLKVPTRVMNEVEYVPLVGLVGALGGNVWQADNRFIAVLPPKQDAGYEIEFTTGSQRVLVNRKPLNLPVPFRFLDNEVYVPTVFINEIFPVKLSRMPQVLSFSLSHARDTTVLRMELDTVAYFSSIAVTSSSFRVYLQADCKIRRMDGTGLVRGIQFGQQNGTVLNVTTTQPCFSRVVRSGNALEVKFTARAQRRINSIIIDPGHGGKDPGALGRRLKEKDVNLDIAQRLSRRLKQLTTADVILTRDKDEYVELYERPRVANADKGDLYVSVHCNSSPDAPGAQGIETFFLSVARTDWERAVASRENGALEFPVSDTNKASADIVSGILRDLAQNEFLRESEQLASDLQSSLADNLHGKDRGVKQADFAVLRNAYMPAALVECGFLTNPGEEKLLAAGDYRERIASALAVGIGQFVKQVESKGGR